MSKAIKLTICFDDPFWIGLVELEEEGRYRVARHVFGAEPSEPEVELFIRDHWSDLRFSPEMKVEKTQGKKINPKRMKRIIEREMAKNPAKSTKAQAALAEQREEGKLERKTKSRAQKEAEDQAAFELRQRKRKEKHRGH